MAGDGSGSRGRRCAQVFFFRFPFLLISTTATIAAITTAAAAAAGAAAVIIISIYSGLRKEFCQSSLLSAELRRRRGKDLKNTEIERVEYNNRNGDRS